MNKRQRWTFLAIGLALVVAWLVITLIDRPADQTWLVYVSRSTSQSAVPNTDLYKMRLGDAQPQQLTHGYWFADNPVWSPDGQWIDYEVIGRDIESQYTNVQRMRTDGTEVQRLTDTKYPKSRLYWSGGWLYYAEYHYEVPSVIVYRMQGDGSHAHVLVELRGTISEYYAWEPAWSPDGQWMVFIADQSKDDTGYLYRMRPDGGSVMRLSDRPISLSNPTLLWSHDGTQIAFNAFSPDRRFEIDSIRPDGSNLRVLLDQGALSMTWAGEWLVVVATDRQIYRVHADGTDVQRLTSQPGDYYGLTWLPGTDWLYYTNDTAEFQPISMYRMHLDGSGLQQIGSDVKSPTVKLMQYNNDWLIYDDGFEVNRMRPDGSEAQALTAYGDGFASLTAPGMPAVATPFRLALLVTGTFAMIAGFLPFQKLLPAAQFGGQGAVLAVGAIVIVFGLTAILLSQGSANPTAPPSPTSTPPYDCSRDIPADVFERATLAPFNTSKTFGLSISPEGHYVASAWGDQYGCKAMNIWVCGGGGLVFQTQLDGGVCGDGAQGHKPVTWTDKGLIVEYRWHPMGVHIPDGPSGYYLFAPDSRTWTLLRENTSTDWAATPPADLVLPGVAGISSAPTR